MKILTSIIISVTSLSLLQGATLVAGGGTLPSGITYTLTSTPTSTGTDGLQLGNGNQTTTISFSAPVDFTIEPPSVAAVNFDDTGTSDGLPSSTFTANTSTWSYTPGNFDISGISTTGTSALAIGDFATPATVSSGVADGFLNGATDWGSYSILGVSTVTWTVAAESNLETFSFHVVGTTVPEPTSAALLGLGGLALIARRRR